MKKLILTVAILAGGMTAFASSNNTVPTALTSLAINEEFKEIAVDKLPATVTSAVEKDFATGTITKAYVNTNDQYKLEISVDGTTSTVYADKDGNWLEESAIKDVKNKTKKTSTLE